MRRRTKISLAVFGSLLLATAGLWGSSYFANNPFEPEWRVSYGNRNKERGWGSKHGAIVFWRNGYIKGRERFFDHAGIYFYRENISSRLGVMMDYIKISYAYPATICITAIGLTLWRERRFTSHRPGFCRHCGYDLRATPHQCPECGAEAVS